MANVKLTFYDPETEDKLQVFANTQDKIFIGINAGIDSDGFNSGQITLDIETAVRFSRELKRHIALLKDELKANTDAEQSY